jgi:hypothetical protein
MYKLCSFFAKFDSANTIFELIFFITATLESLLPSCALDNINIHIV